MDLIQRGFDKFTLDQWNVPEMLKKNGVDDPNMVCSSISTSDFYKFHVLISCWSVNRHLFIQIREFGFREDGLKYWDAMKKYTGGILKLYYKSDDDIKQDFELQNWISEVKVRNH